MKRLLTVLIAGVSFLLASAGGWLPATAVAQQSPGNVKKPLKSPKKQHSKAAPKKTTKNKAPTP